MSTLRFISRNKFKIDEAKRILDPHGITVVPFEHAIEELQTENAESLVRDKAIKAFKKVGRPLFVEHTGLYLDYLNGFPGGLTQIFWDKLQADKFAELFGSAPDRGRVIAKTLIGYVNGKKVKFFRGEIAGKIAPEPRGSREFQWDCVFIPDGRDKTFAEMGANKDEISMRRGALDSFITYFRGDKPCKS
jgi:XTP/dITP diphosphohydrolase